MQEINRELLQKKLKLILNFWIKTNSNPFGVKK